MSITLIDKLKQANDADFKLLDASDLNFDSAAKTIVTDAITQDASAIWNIVDTEASAATDNLSTITRSSKGPNLIIISPTSGARTVVIKHGTGNILCVNNADITLDDIHDFALLIYDGSANWYALSDTTGGGGVSDGDKGDITVSGGGTVWTIDNGVVSLAKMADMATASLIYRKTAGSGAPEVNTLATLKTDLGLTGTNSGDQTSIVGITGTKAQFDTSCSDGNFLYVGDVTIKVETIENKAGSDCSGTDGATNRVLTLANASLSSNEVVVHDRSTLHPTQDYTVSHLSASSTITFLNNVWNDQKIRARYLV